MTKEISHRIPALPIITCINYYLLTNNCFLSYYRFISFEFVQIFPKFANIMSEIINKIKERLSEANGFQGIVFSEINDFPRIELPKDKLLEAANILKNEFHFDQLKDVVGVDRFTKEFRFECIYNVFSNEHRARIFLRVRLDSKKPEVESLCSVWPSANWYEREAYDMVGIIFLNHPDLRRIYLMEEYEYYPLRKDYPLMGLPGAMQLPKK
jgi:NADH-quinone oxidoreductase subunit C